MGRLVCERAAGNKTEHNRLGRFPEAASEDLLTGPKRNFQVFDPLDFLAETSVMIPNSVTSIGFEAFFGCTSLSKRHNRQSRHQHRVRCVLWL